MKPLREVTVKEAEVGTNLPAIRPGTTVVKKESTVPATECATDVRVIVPKRQTGISIGNFGKVNYNSIILDYYAGRIFGTIDPQEHDETEIGKLRTYITGINHVEVYFVKRDKDGSLSPVVWKPPEDEKTEIITPPQLGDALEDPFTGPAYLLGSDFTDLLREYKLPIIIFVLVLAIFLTATMFNPAAGGG